MVLEPEVKSKSSLLGLHYLKVLDREKSDPGLLFFQKSHVRFQEHLCNFLSGVPYGARVS